MCALHHVYEILLIIITIIIMADLSCDYVDLSILNQTTGLNFVNRNSGLQEDRRFRA